MIRVLLVDDQEIIRAGLAAIVDSDPGLTVVAQAADGFAALQVLQAQSVDVILMDLRMPGIDGVEATRRVRERYPAATVRIIVLTTFDQDHNVVNALRAGADGFLGKGASPADIVGAITAAAAGQPTLSSRAVEAVVSHVAEQRSLPPDPELQRRFEQLTVREREVVAEIVAGRDAAEVAEALFLSPFTVKTHINRAMLKVGVRDRGQLVALAVKAGFLR